MPPRQLSATARQLSVHLRKLSLTFVKTLVNAFSFGSIFLGLNLLSFMSSIQNNPSSVPKHTLSVSMIVAQSACLIWTLDSMTSLAWYTCCTSNMKHQTNIHEKFTNLLALIRKKKTLSYQAFNPQETRWDEMNRRTRDFQKQKQNTVTLTLKVGLPTNIS